jgi:hypothetical protein
MSAAIQSAPSPNEEGSFWVVTGTLLTFFGALIFYYSWDALAESLLFGIGTIIVGTCVIVGGVIVFVHGFMSCGSSILLQW